MKDQKTFDDSLAHCKSLGGTLALPESAEENQRILDDLGNIPDSKFSSSLLIE